MVALLAARDKKLTYEAEEKPAISKMLSKGICRRRKWGSHQPVADTEKSPAVLWTLLLALKMYLWEAQQCRGA